MCGPRPRPHRCVDGPSDSTHKTSVKTSVIDDTPCTLHTKLRAAGGLRISSLGRLFFGAARRGERRPASRTATAQTLAHLTLS